MTRLRIIHTTNYRYTQPVSFGPHRLIVRPREGHDVQIEWLTLTVQPGSEISWYRDVFGNSVARVRFLEEADCLEIQNDVVVCRGPQPNQHGLLEAFPVKFPVVYSELEAPLVAGYTTPVYPEETGGLHAWMLANFAPHPECDAVALVHQVGTWIYRNIQYRRREERGVQTPRQTLELKSGSCRDMATLLLEMARSVGLASRFASGYLHSASSLAGRAATHAWTEIYFPEHGWFGFDPTLGEGTSHKHIVTGVSSHPRGVMPVSGSFLGPAEFYAGMTVSVKIENLSPTENERSGQPLQVGGTNKG